MTTGLEHFLVNPGLRLLPDFRPISLAEQKIVAEMKQKPSNIRYISFDVERENGQRVNHEMSIFREGSEHSGSNDARFLTTLKTALWMYGGHTFNIDAPQRYVDLAAREFAPGGQFAFDEEFMGKTVYGTEFKIGNTRDTQGIGALETQFDLDKSSSGVVLFFDIGGSDIKYGVLHNGKELFSDEERWDPKVQTQPEFFVDTLERLLRSALQHAPADSQVTGIGGSAAGVIIDNYVKVASWLRGAQEAGNLEEAGKVFYKLAERFGNVPIRVLNDGTIAARAGQILVEDNHHDEVRGVLGLAFGTSVACGYVSEERKVDTRFNEGAFIPIGYRNGIGPVCDWSKQPEWAGGYLSQNALSHLVPAAGFSDAEIDSKLALPDKLIAVQNYLAQKDPRAREIFETIGDCAGLAIPTYLQYCGGPGDCSHVVIYGRVASRGAQEIITSRSNAILGQYFPEIAKQVKVVVPLSEEHVRKGQAAAAARLV